MQRYSVPVVVEAKSAIEAEAFVEGVMKGRIPAELPPETEFRFVGDAEALEAETG